MTFEDYDWQSRYEIVTSLVDLTMKASGEGQETSEILRQIADRVLEVSEAEWVTCIVFRKPNRGFTLVSRPEEKYGITPLEQKNYLLRVAELIRKEDGHTAWAMEHKKAVVIDDIYAYNERVHAYNEAVNSSQARPDTSIYLHRDKLTGIERGIPVRRRTFEMGFKSIVCLPLMRYNDDAVGVMWLHFKGPLPPLLRSHTGIEELKRFADFAAFIYLRNEMDERWRGATEALTNYLDVNRPIDVFFTRLLRIIRYNLACHCAYIYLEPSLEEPRRFSGSPSSFPLPAVLRDTIKTFDTITHLENLPPDSPWHRLNPEPVHSVIICPIQKGEMKPFPGVPTDQGNQNASIRPMLKGALILIYTGKVRQLYIKNSMALDVFGQQVAAQILNAYLYNRQIRADERQKRMLRIDRELLEAYDITKTIFDEDAANEVEKHALIRRAALQQMAYQIQKPMAAQCVCILLFQGQDVLDAIVEPQDETERVAALEAARSVDSLTRRIARHHKTAPVDHISNYLRACIKNTPSEYFEQYPDRDINNYLDNENRLIELMMYKNEMTTWQAAVGVPMLIRQDNKAKGRECCGVIWLFYNHPIHFTESFLAELEHYASLIASVYHHDRQYLNQLSALHYLQKALREIRFDDFNREESSVMQQVLRIARNLVASNLDSRNSLSHFAHIDPRRHSLSFKHSEHLQADPQDNSVDVYKLLEEALEAPKGQSEITISLEDADEPGIVVHVARHGESLLISQGNKDFLPGQYIDLFASEREPGEGRDGSHVVAPVWQDSERARDVQPDLRLAAPGLYGVLSIEHRDPHVYTQANKRALEALAAHLGNVIEYGRLTKSLHAIIEGSLKMSIHEHALESKVVQFNQLLESLRVRVAKIDAELHNDALQLIDRAHLLHSEILSTRELVPLDADEARQRTQIKHWLENIPWHQDNITLKPWLHMPRNDLEGYICPIHDQWLMQMLALLVRNGLHAQERAHITNTPEIDLIAWRLAKGEEETRYKRLAYQFNPDISLDYAVIEVRNDGDEVEEEIASRFFNQPIPVHLRSRKDGIPGKGIGLLMLAFALKHFGGTPFYHHGSSGAMPDKKGVIFGMIVPLVR